MAGKGFMHMNGTSYQLAGTFDSQSAVERVVRLRVADVNAHMMTVDVMLDAGDGSDSVKVALDVVPQRLWAFAAFFKEDPAPGRLIAY